MELFDVVDEMGVPTGEIVSRSEAHDKDIRHRTAHVWILRAEGGRIQVLLQKRAAGKDSFPGCYDTSSAGHIPAGIDPVTSALRELEEELGIRASADELEYAGLFYSHYEKVFYGKPFRDNEVTFVYIYTGHVDIECLKLQQEEVEAVRWFEADYVSKMLEPPRDAAFCVPLEGFNIAVHRFRSVLQRGA